LSTTSSSFLSNIIFLIAINLIVKPFYVFVIERDVQNVVGTADYGIYFTLLNLTLLLSMLNDFGIRNFASRYIAQHSHLLQKYFPDLFAIKLILSGLYLLLVGVLAIALGYWKSYALLVSVLALSRLTISWIDFFRSIIIGLERYRMDSWLSVLPRLSLLVIGAILLWIPALRTQFSIEWFVYAELTALIISLAATLFIVLPYLRQTRLRFHRQRTLFFLRQSLPYALIAFLMMIYSRIDAVMLEQILPNGQEEVGIYAAAYRLLDAAIMFSFLFANLLLPMFARLLKQQKELLALVNMSSQLLLSISIAATVSVFLFRQEIMQLLYVDSTVYWGQILGMLMWSFIAVSATHIFGTALLADGRLKALNCLFVVGIALNVLLNALFIPHFGAYAAATTTLLTQSFIVLGELWLVRRLLRLDLRSSFTKLLLFGSVYFAVSWWSTQWQLLNWGFHFIGLLLFGALLTFAFRLIEWRSIQLLWKNK
jgi:O-antigen/teichoic acid export membrane protein